MNDIAHNAFAFILGLGFLIFIHEAGHFFVAKLFRVRVLVFSFGFGKRLFGFQHGDTDYRVSIFPLGGYVRMAGDSPEENVPGSPDEFLSKPKWQRFLILVAGPLMNILVAIMFIAALAMIGREEVVMKPVVGEVLSDKPAAKAGLKRGDTIVSINDERVQGFDDIRLMVSMNAETPLRFKYLRDGVVHQTTLTPEKENSEYGPVGRAGFFPGVEAVIGRTDPGSPAARAGLQPGDRIVAANGKRVADLSEYVTIANTAANKPIALVVQRGAARVNVTLAAHEDADRGIVPPTRLFKLSLFPALRYSVEENWRMLRYAVAAVKRMFRSEGSVKELSGPLSIARISGDMLRRGPIEFVALLAMISLQLGVMNLLPVPVLDGGHIMILLIEGIARRDLSLRVKERIQQLGFAALATLMIVVLYHDVVSNVLRLKDG
ncbi:MAG TPA: RIP metalloprotease RseP [Thermoanaerobaculia bacterium]|nr:RIP metalloprotease RseP [Thermoanaerobaculia bacterium]